MRFHVPPRVSYFSLFRLVQESLKPAEWRSGVKTNRTSGDEFEELLLEVADLGRHARFVLAMLLDAFLPVSGMPKIVNESEFSEFARFFLVEKSDGATATYISSSACSNTLLTCC